jgi:hypothetical protein
MKSITRVIKERPEYRSLIEGVVRNIDKENIPDINRHGIDGGYGNFIYYVDTVKFWRKHRKIITQLAEEQWEDIGYANLLDMISSFNCCKGEDAGDIAKAFYGRYDDEYDHIYNCLAWYAAEEVCRWFEE